MNALPEYELFAIRYATREARRADHFIGGDPHDGPMPMDYFVWVAKSAERAFVIDCGFTEETAKKRKRTFLRDPIDALKLVGVDADTVQDVILTHLHYDHVGGFNRFPKAKFHLQEPEIHYATGRYMQYHRLAHSFEVEDIVGVVRLNFAHRVSFHNGGAELAPGITLHPVGGHSMGLQFVQGAYQARLGRGRLRHHALLREHDDRPAVHHGAPHRADAGSLRHAAARRRRPRSTSCRATTRR